jgi:hypothetical protein
MSSPASLREALRTGPSGRVTYFPLRRVETTLRVSHESKHQKPDTGHDSGNYVR